LWPEVRVAIGVHPHHAGRHSARPVEARDIVAAQLEATPEARAIGEIGLDYHYDFAPRDVQQDVFRAQLELAIERDLPVVIHTREADDDTVAILRESGVSRGVLHCFTGTPALRDAALALGFHISLAGIVTVPKAGDLRETTGAVPLARILTETDSPFLAPVPFRGKRNEPAHVVQVVEALANVFKIAPAELDRHATTNFHTLFRP
jgi:TatD DNase family protein